MITPLLHLVKKPSLLALALTLTLAILPATTAAESLPVVNRSKLPDRAELTALLPTAQVGKDDKSRIIGVMQSALQGKELTVMGIGTSIMAGANADDFKKTSLSPLIYEWWVGKFPNAKIKFINAGMGASSAVFAVHRADRDILKHNPDFTVIDYSGGEKNFEAEGFEGLIRKMFIQRPQSAVVSIIQGGQSHTQAPDVHVAICENYGIPVLSVPKIFQPLLKSGRIAWSDWSTDTIHPNNDGHRMIADLVISYLEECYKEAVKLAEPIKIAALNPPVTPNGFAKSAVYDASSLKPADAGNWTPFLEKSGWNNSWAASAEGPPMVFKLKAKSLIFGYRKTIKPTNGKLIIKLDGQPFKEIDPNFKKGWGDWVPNDTVFKSDQAQDHTIEFIYSGNPGEPIMIKYLLIAE
jgi:hypothetical protein